MSAPWNTRPLKQQNNLYESQDWRECCSLQTSSAFCLMKNMKQVVRQIKRRHSALSGPSSGQTARGDYFAAIKTDFMWTKLEDCWCEFIRCCRRIHPQVQMCSPIKRNTASMKTIAMICTIDLIWWLLETMKSVASPLNTYVEALRAVMWGENKMQFIRLCLRETRVPRAK